MFHRSRTGAKGRQMRTRNMSAILLSFLSRSGISRVQLAEQTGLSTTTIANLTSELLDNEIITEDGTIEDIRFRSVGRPQRALYLVPDARCAVSVHINIGYAQVAITNLYGETLAGKTLHFGEEPDADMVLADIAQTVNGLLADQHINRAQVLGVGIAASGLVNTVTGINVLAPNLGWHDVPLRDYFESRLNLPVCVDNNVRAMALGEAMFGIAHDVGSLAFVYSHIGVGAGLVVGGELYRGGAGGAGEIGHTTIILHDGQPCRCGNQGCLETLVSDRVIAQLGTQLAARNRVSSPTLYEYMQRQSYDPIENIFAAARAGDEPTRQMLRKRAEYMGVAMANLVNIFNPEMIVFGGTFAQGAELLLPTVEKVIRERAFADLGEQVQVRATQFEQEGTVGAAALALNAFFYRDGVLAA